LKNKDPRPSNVAFKGNNMIGKAPRPLYQMGELDGSPVAEHRGNSEI